MLYVDDQRPAPKGFRLVKTINDAIRIISDGLKSRINLVEVVDLDYDIYYTLNAITHSDGEIEMIEGKENDSETWFDSPEKFAAVARYIMLIPKDLRPEVRIHTANPKGEAILRDILNYEGLE